MAITQLTLSQARLSWWQRQRLSAQNRQPEAALSTAGLVSEVGWIPLPTIVTAPLAMYARNGMATRAHMQQLLGESPELLVVPGARGSCFLVPTAEAHVCRSFAVADLASREARIAASTALNLRELDQTRAMLRLLLRRPLTTSELVSQLSPIALRPLGSVGQRNGVMTVAALVLKQLWACGEVMQLGFESRLDDAATRWQLDPSPRVVPNAADAIIPAVYQWLKAFSPVSLRAFARAFDLSPGRAKSAFDEVGASVVTVEGFDDLFYVLGQFEVPEERELSVQLLPVRDPLTDALCPLLLPPSIAEKSVVTKQHGVGATIVHNGAIIGTWAYDDAGKKVHLRYLVDGVSTRLAEAVQAQAHKLEIFAAQQWPTLPLHGVYIPRVKPTSELGMLL